MSQARYSILPTAALEDDRVTALELRILAVIGSFLDKNLRGFPSQQTIAERAKCSRQSVNKALKRLADYGYVSVIGRPNKGLKRALKYQVNLDVNLSDIEAESSVFADVKNNDIDVNESDNDVKPGGDNDVKPKEVTAKEYTQYKIPTNSARRSAQDVVSEILELLPVKKRRMAPRDSLPKLVRPILKQVSADELLAAVRACYSQPRHTEDGGQFAPAVHSWLKNGVWKNWIDDQPAAEGDRLTREDWATAMRAYVEQGQWYLSLHSPPPDQPECKAPTEMLRHCLNVLPASDPRLEGIRSNLKPRSAA